MQKTYNELFREIYNGDNIEETMEMMKKSGASQRDTLIVLMDELCISLRDADDFVLNAKAWKESKEPTEWFRNSMSDLLKILQVTINGYLIPGGSLKVDPALHKAFQPRRGALAARKSTGETLRRQETRTIRV